ncbi:MAG: nicotinate phosphoribosyltransferase [Anaerolineae bacterium]|nr:nicotinate phosphoribosyltransferase [Anaerolineae bacterium]
MSRFNGNRLSNRTFKLDVERMRQAWYSDKYFWNIADTLSKLAKSGYRFRGQSEVLAQLGITAQEIDVGNMQVEMQVFTRRSPSVIVCGIDKALAMLRHCTGYLDQDRFVETYDQLEVWAVQDGDIVHYDGDPMHVQPVLRIRGRYRDFAILETPILGVLSRGSRIATNVYNVLKAARGKQVLFFPARFDVHEVQAADGYAYDIAVQRFNADHGSQLASAVSTDAQGDWWGGVGGGTIAHAAIACFLGDTAEAVIAFAETRDVNIPRIALVDFHNDCIGDTLKVMQAMFSRYRECLQAGKPEEAKKYKLYGVRPDTSSSLRDLRVEPLGDPSLDCGVNPRLVFDLRRAVDSAYLHWDLPPDWLEPARQWCREVKIVVTGGFNPAKIERFEQLQVPADIYGVGSHLLNSCAACGTNTDFTADVVRARLNDQWVDMVKVGRQACNNDDLEKVDWETFVQV